MSKARTWTVLLALALVLSACAGGDGDAPADEGAEGTPGESSASAETVKVAGIWPLSGPFSAQGQDVRAGAEAAIEDINAAGGIEALDGAQLELVVGDAGANPESAASTAESVLADEEIVVATGGWTSTLAIPLSAVAERLQVPFLGDAFAPEYSSRGFDYAFTPFIASGDIAQLLYDNVQGGLEAAGQEVDRAAVIGDDSPAAVPQQDALIEMLEADGVSVDVQTRWTPPLSDPVSLASEIERGDVDVIFLIAFQFEDVSQLVGQLRARGITAPIVQSGGQAVRPEWRELGADVTEGLLGQVAFAPTRQTADLAADLAERLGVPFVSQDQLIGYFQIQLMKAGLEAAGEADREALRAALTELDVREGVVADLVSSGCVAFGDDLRLTPECRYSVIVQWQTVDGALTPCTIFPEQSAICEGRWTLDGA